MNKILTCAICGEDFEKCYAVIIPPDNEHDYERYAHAMCWANQGGVCAVCNKKLLDGTRCDDCCDISFDDSLDDALNGIENSISSLKNYKEYDLNNEKRKQLESILESLESMEREIRYNLK